MARTRRIQLPGLLRHVMSRGNGRMTIFHDHWDYLHFVNLLADVVETFDIECWNYCLMPNHYHATLKPAQENLSEAIRRLNSCYALWWNRRHQRVGHVFQGRFKAQIVQEDAYLLRLSRYVVMNPVRAGLTESPDKWRWSSYGATAGLHQSPTFLSVIPTLQQFGPGAEDVLQARFREFVTSDPSDRQDIDVFRSATPIIGDRPFKSMWKGALVAGRAPHTSGHDRADHM